MTLVIIWNGKGIGAADSYTIKPWNTPEEASAYVQAFNKRWIVNKNHWSFAEVVNRNDKRAVFSKG